MNDAMTLRKLLQTSGSQVRVYDLGRRIGALADELFDGFERGTAPYPTPLQHKAHFALVQLHDPAAPLIWFLYLSLDEQGLLIPAERDYLLARLLESAQAHQRGGDPQAFLRDNPHAFTPREDRMALFHARLAADLGLPPSRFYAHALDYFRGTPGWAQWEFVGYQGIADVACRHDDEPLAGAIAHLPGEPLIALCHCLESQTIGADLKAALLARLQREYEKPRPTVAEIAALVRALASRSSYRDVIAAFSALLASPAGGEIEVLVAISGRAWEALHDRPLLNRYLRALLDQNGESGIFAHCITDLLSLPELANGVRAALRSDEQDDSVRAAFQAMT